MLAKTQNLPSLRLLAWGSVSSYYKSFASGLSGIGLSPSDKPSAECRAHAIDKTGGYGAASVSNFRILHLPHSPAVVLSAVDVTTSRCRPLSTLSGPFIHTTESSNKVCEANLMQRRGYSQDKDAGSPPPEKRDVEASDEATSEQPEVPGVWGNWIAKRFSGRSFGDGNASGTNSGNDDGSSGLESSEEDVRMEAQGSTPGGGSQSQFGGIDEGLDAELEALLAQDGDDKWGSGSEAREEDRDGIQNRGGGWRVPGGGVGMVERSDEGPPIEHEISQAARDTMEEFDLEEEEEGSRPPYMYRSGHVYFPGHSYEIEDVDLSMDPPVSEEAERGARIRKTYTTAEALQKADFRNVRFMLGFLSETAKTLPRHKTGLSAKAQRKVSHEIRIARCLGLVPFTSIGRPQYRFQRSRVMNEPGGEDYGGSPRPPIPSLYGQRRTPSPVRNRRLDSSWDSTSLAKRNDSRSSQP